MEILWSAVGICVIVCFVFYVLATHWQRVLRHQSWMVRKLGDRVQELEEISDPQFRRRLGESAPMPLEQVYTLAFRLSDRFWQETLGISEENRSFIRRFGSFVGSVKLERWRSHTVATITEVLPESKTASWQSRAIDFYPDSESEADSLTLWELRLAPQNRSASRPPSLELILQRRALELRGHLLHSSSPSDNGNGNGAEAPDQDVTFFRVPLNFSELVDFRSQDPVEDAGSDEGNSSSNGAGAPTGSWRAFYSSADEEIGFEWQLRLRDLTRKAEWDRWQILEAGERRAIHG